MKLLTAIIILIFITPSYCQFYLCVETQSFHYDLDQQSLTPISCNDNWAGPRFYHPWSKIREYWGGLNFILPGDFGSELKTQWTELEIDLLECTTSDISSFTFKNTIAIDIKKDSRLFWPYYVDYRGQIYFSNATDKTIGTKPIFYRSNNYLGNNPELTRLELDLDVNFLLSDMTIYKDRLLVLGFEGEDNFLFHFDVITSALIKKIPLDIPVTQIASLVQDCDSIQMYGFLNFRNSEFGEIDTVHMYKLNVEAGKFTDHVTITAPDIVILFNNVISPSEFLASETNCDLLIDLDRNNSGLLFPYDFSPEDRLCFGNTAKIADEDTYVHTSYPLDYIDIVLKGVRDAGQESLRWSGSPLGISFIEQGNGRYRLRATSENSPDSIYAAALKNLIYENTADPKTYGVRDIQMVGHNVARSGDTIHSYVTIGITNESDALICENDSLDYEGNKYVVGDTITKWLLASEGCDTLIQIYVKSKVVPQIEVTGYELFCFGNPIVLTSNIHQFYKWTQGERTSTNQSFTVTETVEVMLQVTNSEGCTADTTINILQGLDFTLQLVDEVLIIEGDSTSIEVGIVGDTIATLVVDPSGVVQNLDNTRLYFDGQSSETINITVTGKGGCIVTKSLFLEVIPLNLKARIPNILSKEGGGNSEWDLYLGEGIEALECAIYDRWGNEVFRFDPPDMTVWSGDFAGKLVDDGVYTYYLVYKNRNDSIGKLSGDITVLH